MRDPEYWREWPCGCLERKFMRDNGPMNLRIPEVHRKECGKGASGCQRYSTEPRHVPVNEMIDRIRRGDY